MKAKQLLSFIFLLLTAITAWADVEINEENFPDENFRNWVLSQSYGADGVLTDDEISSITSISVRGKKIQSLKGIEYFTAMTSLNCSQNQLTELDVSKNTALSTLQCFQNQIKGNGMDVLVESLPTVGSGNMRVIFNKDEQNEMTSDQAAAAKAKGWTPYEYDGSWRIYSSAIAVNEENFPDESFRNWLFSQEYGKDGRLTDNEIAKVTSIDVAEDNIQSLKGIEYFTALTSLLCYGNQLSTLDVSKNTKLEILRCYVNQLTMLNVSGCSALKDLDCGENQLTELDVSQSTKLTILICWDNKLTALDVSQNTKLTELRCDVNQLTTLDVSRCTALTSLKCWGNQLTELDVSACTRLTYLDFGGNQLQDIDVLQNTNLTTLVCWGNQLTSIDISQNTELTVLSISTNRLTELDMSQNRKLKKLWCNENQLTALNVSKNTALTYLNCHDNQLAVIDVSKNTSLTELYCDGNQLSTLDVSKNTSLTELNFGGNQLTALDVSKNTKLKTLYCYNNQLTSLDVSKNTSLTELYCFYNQLISLDVSKNTKLAELDCDYNQLTELDLSNNIALTELYCQINRLTALDVSNNTKLTVLYCYRNQIKGAGMDALVKSLPTVSNGSMRVIYNKDEQNVMTTDQVAAAKAKGWTPLYSNGEFDEEGYLLWNVYSGSEQVVDNISINAKNFPDANFRNYLLAQEYGTDGVLTMEEITNITKINVKGSNIQDMKGIEYFTALKVLYCYDNQLASLDVSKNSALTTLGCSSNQLTALDVSKNTELAWLNCGSNKLTSLDVSQNTTLTSLQCYDNQLTSLDIFNTTALTELYCYDNQLTSLDVSNNIALTLLSCFRNQLTSLDVSNNIALKELYCYVNQLMELDVTKNTALTTLECFSNQLTSLDVSNNIALTLLSCENNQLTSLNVSQNTALTKLWCYDNQLTSLDVSNNIALTVLNCSSNQLTVLDVSNNTSLTLLSCDNNQLTSLDVSNNIAFTRLYCYNNQLTSLNVSNNIALTVLNCSSNQLTVLDVSNNTALTYLICHDNKLSTLDVSKNTALTYLDCHDNKLSTLDVSKNTALTYLDCRSNSIKNEAMDALVESLPTVTGGFLSVINNENEQNVMTVVQVEAAKAKGWTPLRYTGEVDEEGYEIWKKYDGSEAGATMFLKVTNEEGKEIKDNVNIVWYAADGKEIGTGTKLNGIVDSTEVYYSVLLEETLGRVYREVKMQKVMAGEKDTTITCQLEKIGRILLEGRVSATDIDKTTATVNVRQMLNGKWEQSYTTQTNEQGVFKVEVYDDETDITISGKGYLDATLHRNGFGGYGNVGTIPLNLLSGFAIAANITIQKAVAIGEAEDVTAWTDGLNNIEFILTNTTNNATITDFTVQNGNVIIKTGAEVGDEINLTAKNKQGMFADATTTFTIADGANAFDLQLTEMGGIDATCASSNNGITVGYLYNCNGVLTAKGTYTGETLSMRHLPNGTYTLITMGSSTLLHNMTHLADIVSVGLNEGTDYLTANVEISDGELTAVAVNEVPRLDDTRFYYTSSETYFIVNKPSVTAGNYLTLQAHVNFKAEHADKAESMTLTIDLPEGCQMVENSVIVNRQAVAHTVNGNRISIPLTKEQYESQLRFCIIPIKNQNYTITAMASFDIDGQVTQPIGSAQFEAKGLSLSVPGNVVSTNVTINGTANGHSEVSIYDNDVLIGKTSSKADGSWTAECELYKPYSHSFHDIYAKIKTENGMELTSEVRQVEYDKNGNVPEKVMMTFYNAWMKKNIDVEFNLLEGTTTPSSYPFYKGTDFTFLAEFTHNDSTQIKNVNLKVQNSDGTVRTLPAIFDSKQNKWVATTKYESSSKLPQNVKVEYDMIPTAEDNDTERNDDNLATLNSIKELLCRNLEDAQFELVENSDVEYVFSFISSANTNREYLGISIENYDSLRTQYEDREYMMLKNDTVDYCYSDSITANGQYHLLILDNNKKTAYTIKYLGENYSNKNNTKRKVHFVVNLLTGFLTNGFDYYLKTKNVNYWNDVLRNDQITYNQYYNRMIQALDSRCPNGEYKINRNSLAYDYNNLSVEVWKFSSEMFLSNLDMKIREERNYLFTRFVRNCFISGVLARLSSFIPLNSIGVNPKLVDILYSTHFAIIEGTLINGVDNHDNRETLNKWYVEESRRIMNEYNLAYNQIQNACSRVRCEGDDDEEDDDDFNGKGTTPEIDPSGYVYEAVTSNRLEGVTVTCYQKVQTEDMYGDITEEAVVWNAEDYSQKNPLQTDETGFYRWDVPQGWWQVKYEKEGYETTYSDWLPVPPPQLDVNIGMKQSTPPTVKQIRGYESGITIELSKYMRPETITAENITVTHNGSAEKGCIELMNAEKAPLDNETFVSKVKFVPENPFKATDLVVVTVHKEIESYCGVKMTTDHVETVKIEPEVKSIEVDSVLNVIYHGEKELSVMVLPKEASAGKTLRVKTSSEMITSISASEITIDQDGAAILTLGGELLGGAVLDFSVDGTDITATSKVQVVKYYGTVATPTVNIASGSMVYMGTKIGLFCETEGATIYYTTDGSCPCDENGSRKIYEGTPIVINENTTIKAIAVALDMIESDIAEFVYTIPKDEEDAIQDISVNGNVQVYPLPVRDVLNVTANGEIIRKVTVSSMNGTVVASSMTPATKVTLDVSSTPTGLYIISILTDDNAYSRKILKIE